MRVGRLEIEMLAEMARLSKDMADAKRIVSGAMGEIERVVGRAKSVLGSLGVGLSLGGLSLIGKQAIDAVDALDDLSKRTRIASEDLAGLRFAAKIGGTELNTLATAINKLAQNMGANAERFAALGVSARDPIEAMKQLADATNAIADPQLRAATLSAALGKSWEQIAPFLAEGGARIGELTEKGKEMAGVTEEMVGQAAAFNDKLDELAGNGGGVNAVMAEMLPLLNATADGLLEGGKSMTLWQAAGSALTEVLRVVVVLVGNVGFLLKGIGNDIAATAAQMVAVVQGDLKRATEIARMQIQDDDARKKSFEAWERGIMAVGSAAKKSTPELQAMDQVQRRMASEASAAARAFLEAEERKRNAAKAAEEAAKKAAADRLQRAQAEIDAEEMFAQDYLEAWAAVYAQRTKESLAEAKIRMDAAAAEAKAEEMFAQDMQEAWHYYNELLKKQGVERQAQIEQQMQTWSDLAGVAGDFFADLVMNGRSAFDNLKRWVKELLAQMVALFAKRWILNMAANGSAGSAGGAAGNALMSAAGDGIAGTALNFVGGAAATWAMGTAGAGALGATAGGAFAQGAMGVGTGVWASGSAGAMGASMSGIYSALAAIPVWGWIALAVIAIGAWIAGNHKGGPKVGGSFMGGFDAAGLSTGGVAVPGTDNGRFFTPSQGDSQVQRFVHSTSAGFYDALTRFGGTTAGMRFGLGFDHDPNGTAQSRVSSMVTDAQGRVIYSNLDRSMDDKEVPAQMQLEAKRMLLAALQASDLPAGVAQIINSVTDIRNATEQQINDVIALATAYQNLTDTIAALEGGPLVALDQQLKGMKDRVDAGQQALARALEGGDPGEILAAEQNLAAAIMDRYNQELQMVRNLQQAIRDLEEQSYQFALGMAGRINAVGGSRDVGAIAMNRAGVLRGRVGGNAPAAHQMQDVQSYVGAIDTWYNARRDAIMRDAQAQAAAAQAIAQAQASASQARVAQLQGELALAQQFQSVIDRSQQILDEMRLSAANPLALSGRLGLAGEDVAAARARYQSATGHERVSAANALLDALVRQRDMGMQAFQRPSQEWQDLYNSIVSEITTVQSDTKPLAELAIDLQREIIAEQQRANSYAAASLSAEQIAASQLASLDEEALGYYEWAEEQGLRLFEVQRQEHQDLLDRITGGMEPNLYIAERAKETVEELKGLRSDLLAAFSEGGAGRVNVTVNVTGGGNVDTNAVVAAVRAAAPTIRRVLAVS